VVAAPDQHRLLAAALELLPLEEPAGEHQRRPPAERRLAQGGIKPQRTSASSRPPSARKRTIGTIWVGAML
jgi:hypothetical protein